MSAETNGPMVVEPSKTDPPSGWRRLTEPFGRVGLRITFRIVDALMQQLGEERVKYNATANRLCFYGESEDSGDRIQRVRDLYTLLHINTLLWVVLFAYSFAAGHIVANPLISVPSLILSLLFANFICGGGETISRCEVVDYTTQTIDDCDDLKQRYLRGEIDERELEAETEARLK